jgi:hypothetical protein
VIIGSMRPLLLASALATMAGLSLLVSACGSTGNHAAQLGTTTPTTNAERMLAFSRCVREHGVPNYPDPDSSGHLPAGGKQIARSSSKFPAVENACMHLLSSGAGTEQQRQQKFAFALKLAQCIRRHGFPTFPDPNGSSQGLPPGIDPNAPRFQAAQTTCQKQVQQALGLP